MHIDIHEQSKDSLPQLVKRAVAGEEIILDSNGKSIAKLIPFPQLITHFNLTSVSKNSIIYHKTFQRGE